MKFKKNCMNRLVLIFALFFTCISISAQESVFEFSESSYKVTEKKRIL